MCRMSNFKSIREQLDVTQSALAAAIGCSQGNVSFYEKGQTLPPDAARRLIAYAKTLGHDITFDQIYSTEQTTEALKPQALAAIHSIA